MRFCPRPRRSAQVPRRVGPTCTHPELVQHVPGGVQALAGRRETGPELSTSCLLFPPVLTGTWNRWQQVPPVPLRSVWRPTRPLRPQQNQCPTGPTGPGIRKPFHALLLEMIPLCHVTLASSAPLRLRPPAPGLQMHSRKTGGAAPWWKDAA